MILEAIVTTVNEDQSPNISPMGPTVPQTTAGIGLERFELRPFNTSRTFANLKRTKMGVLHITDDVEIFARAAIGSLDPLPRLTPALNIEGFAIADACRWHEFKVESIDETGPRMSLDCRTVYSHHNRDFWGFNRAKHAVLEAAILATRVAFLPAEEIQEQFLRLQTIVEKTGGQQEHAAFDRLVQFVGRVDGSRINAQ